MSYPSLDKRIALCDTKPEILQSSADWNCTALNVVIKSLREQAADLRHRAYELTDKANILDDEVRRRAEQMECRILATTDDDYK